MKKNIILAYLFTIKCLSAEYYSQCGQDKYVYENFFDGKKEGIFVDVGAHDGIFYNNSKFFEELGWQGLCIEPLPEVFDQLSSNRKCVCIQGCISDKKGKAKFLQVAGEPEMLSGLFDKYDPRHLNRVFQEASNRSFGKAPQLIEVDCYLLNDILERHNLFHVDFLSIDTEGCELDILYSIDFEKFDISVIDVENNFNDEKIRKFLLSKGYRLVCNTGWDEIFKKM